MLSFYIQWLASPVLMLICTLSLETGIAQIPLYSAPDMAQVSQAPALSSFAPRPPLHDSSSTAPTKTVAHAAATVTGDGRVVVIKRQKGFERGKARYSTWLKL